MAYLKRTVVAFLASLLFVAGAWAQEIDSPRAVPTAHPERYAGLALTNVGGVEGGGGGGGTHRVLQTSGLATAAISVIAVDLDGVTVRDFVTGNNITVDSHMVIGSSSWKGTTGGTFETLKAGSDNFNGYGITYSSPFPQFNFSGATGSGFFAAAATISATQGPSGVPVFTNDVTVGTNGIFGLPTISTIPLTPQWNVASHADTAATSALTSGVKTSFGGDFKSGGTFDYYKALETDGSMTQIGSFTDAGFSGNKNLTNIGKFPSNGWSDITYFIIAFFNRPLTSTEFNSLHTNFYTTLFQ